MFKRSFDTIENDGAVLSLVLGAISTRNDEDAKRELEFLALSTDSKRHCWDKILDAAYLFLSMRKSYLESLYYFEIDIKDDIITCQDTESFCVLVERLLYRKYGKDIFNSDIEYITNRFLRVQDHIRITIRRNVVDAFVKGELNNQKGEETGMLDTTNEGAALLADCLNELSHMRESAARRKIAELDRLAMREPEWGAVINSCYEYIRERSEYLYNLNLMGGLLDGDILSEKENREEVLEKIMRSLNLVDWRKADKEYAIRIYEIYKKARIEVHLNIPAKLLCKALKEEDRVNDMEREYYKETSFSGEELQ